MIKPITFNEINYKNKGFTLLKNHYIIKSTNAIENCRKKEREWKREMLNNAPSKNKIKLYFLAVQSAIKRLFDTSIWITQADIKKTSVIISVTSTSPVLFQSTTICSHLASRKRHIIKNYISKSKAICL